MATIDPTPEQLHAHITGQPLRADIHSPFNACMHRDDCKAADAQVLRAIARVNALEAELEALRKDAERYRWLRAQHWNTYCFPLVIYPSQDAMPAAREIRALADGMRAAIGKQRWASWRFANGSMLDRLVNAELPDNWCQWRG
jgi:hypothetical protein